jgi:hypothetical protein
MVGRLLVRGLFVGLLASVLAFGFAKVFGEPQVDSGIAFEQSVVHMHSDDTDEPALVSRQMQASYGLFSGVVVYGTALGGLFALVFACALNRVGPIGPRGLSALLALVAFVAVILVPDLKYPANPPSVGDPDSLGQRTELFFLMLLVSVAAMAIAVRSAWGFIARYGLWGGVTMTALLYIIIVACAGALFPSVNVVPEHFSAVQLWDFRVASLGIQAVLWSAIGLIFGAWAQRMLVEAKVSSI